MRYLRWLAWLLWGVPFFAGVGCSAFGDAGLGLGLMAGAMAWWFGLLIGQALGAAGEGI